ncbi:MAG: helix-turn-helix transcriptional regulator [Burkholderiaceae bacterium]|nr:helix-turn-helix transcriptional regulator [Burkholderiaceae bacterium]
MRTWQLDPRTPHGPSVLDRAATLVAALGVREDRSFAQAVLGLFGDLSAISQCTVFVHEAGRRVRTLSVADYRSSSYLRTVADVYAQRFHTLDGIQSILTAPAQTLPMLHRQSSTDIGDETYRHVCYQRPRVSERLTLLAPQPGKVWLSVNLYRDDQGDNRRFQPGEIARVEAAAPLVMHAVTRHYALCSQHSADETPMIGRLMQRCPDLTPRERDVLHGMLEGRSTPEIAARLGVQPSSVVSYQKRAYRRLGISGQRQLLALLQRSAMPGLG